MRTAPTILFLLVVSTALLAQSWCPPGAMWTYQFDGWGADYRMEYRYAGDTLFEGRMTKKSIWAVSGSMFGNPYHDTGTEYTAVEEDVVYGWAADWATGVPTWDTLYWFGAMPGDRWYPPGEDRSCPPNGMIEVLDTGSAEIGGLVLRRLLVGRLYGDDGDWGDSGYITERIGMTPRYPEVISCDAVIDYFFPYFVCYSDDQIQLPAGADCSISMGLPELKTEAPAFTLHPNPGNDWFQLPGLGAGKVELLVMDMQGRVVLDKRSVYDDELIGTTGLAAGSYMVELRTDGGQLHRLRWVKR